MESVHWVWYPLLTFEQIWAGEGQKPNHKDWGVNRKPGSAVRGSSSSTSGCEGKKWGRIQGRGGSLEYGRNLNHGEGDS